MSMKTKIRPLISLVAWQLLETHCLNVRELHLGKALAARIIPELETGAKCQLKHDSSTNTLIRRYGRSKELLHGR